MTKLNEGIEFDSNKFKFDFKSNKETNIIQFDDLPLEPVVLLKQ